VDELTPGRRNVTTTESAMALVQRAREYLLPYAGEFREPVIAEAEGALLRDTEGREYLDFGSGQMAATVGHRHPAVTRAIERAAGKVVHLETRQLSEEVIALGEALGQLVPRPLKVSLFLSTGGESVEAALRIARLVTGREGIVAVDRGYHGLTAGAASATFPHRTAGPFLAGNYPILAPYCYRCPLSLTFPGCEFACVDVGLRLVESQAPADSLAALVVEPILSAGGILEPPPGYLPKLLAECRRRGMLLILDEAQTGIGRTGTMFAFEPDGAVPDLLALSKSLGAGMPISAVVMTEEVAARAVAGGYRSVTSHQSDPLPAAAALAVIEAVVEEDLVRQAAEKGAYLKGRLQELAVRYPVIGDVRGRGLLLGIEWVKDRESKEPNPELASAVHAACERRGLHLPGGAGHIWRVAPPIITTYEQLDRAVAILDDALAESVRGT
jgi:2,2-dialkylglycine decarboxylase (pyruvate)